MEVLACYCGTPVDSGQNMLVSTQQVYSLIIGVQLNRCTYCKLCMKGRSRKRHVSILSVFLYTCNCSLIFHTESRVSDAHNLEPKQFNSEVLTIDECSVPCVSVHIKLHYDVCLI